MQRHLSAVLRIDPADDVAVAIRPARNELNDEREIAIWKTGVTL
jgi:hypothetical protein